MSGRTTASKRAPTGSAACRTSCSGRLRNRCLNARARDRIRAHRSASQTTIISDLAFGDEQGGSRPAGAALVTCPGRTVNPLSLRASFCGMEVVCVRVSPVGMEADGIRGPGTGVRGRVVGLDRVRGRPGLLRYSTRVGSGPATLCVMGCSGRWWCGRSVFLGGPLVRVGSTAGGASRGSSVDLGLAARRRSGVGQLAAGCRSAWSPSALRMWWLRLSSLRESAMQARLPPTRSASCR